MNTPATTVLSAGSTGQPYLTGNFAPLMNEVTAFELEIVGRVPDALNGRFLRIGPNPVDEPHPLWLVGHHWFAGAGMVHGLKLRDGKAEWFRSRFVVDEHTAKVRRIKPIPGPGAGQRDGNVNTNLTLVGGKLCAVVEAGSIPVELDYELESVRRTDFDGTLEAGFSGHPHFDPITGEQHALAYEPFAAGALHLGRPRRPCDDQGAHRPAAHPAHSRHGLHAVIHRRPGLPGDVPAPGRAHPVPVALGRAAPVAHRTFAARRRRLATAVVRDAALLRLPLRQCLRRRRPHDRRPDEAPEYVPSRPERSERRRSDPGPVDVEPEQRTTHGDHPRRPWQRVPAHQRAPRRTGLSLSLHVVLG